jgi:hypothetical protein
MSRVNRPNRKASDEDLIKLNSVGLSLGTIANHLGVHPTTVTLRLKGLGVLPADTRRTFMEDIFMGLSESQQHWLAEQLGAHTPIKDYVKTLIVQEFINKKAA